MGVGWEPQWDHVTLENHKVSQTKSEKSWWSPISWVFYPHTLWWWPGWSGTFVWPWYPMILQLAHGRSGSNVPSLQPGRNLNPFSGHTTIELTWNVPGVVKGQQWQTKMEHKLEHSWKIANFFCAMIWSNSSLVHYPAQRRNLSMKYEKKIVHCLHGEIAVHILLVDDACSASHLTSSQCKSPKIAPWSSQWFEEIWLLWFWFLWFLLLWFQSLWFQSLFCQNSGQITQHPQLGNSFSTHPNESMYLFHQIFVLSDTDPF